MFDTEENVQHRRNGQQTLVQSFFTLDQVENSRKKMKPTEEGGPQRRFSFLRCQTHSSVSDNSLLNPLTHQPILNHISSNLRITLNMDFLKHPASVCVD